MENGLRLLGVPARDTAGGALELPPGQVTHLAALLALRGAWVAREELVDLLWPDFDSRRGRHNLAQLLYALRKAPWGADLETEPQRIRWSVATDVAEFRSAASEGQWRTAAERYAGDLLTGVQEPTSPQLAEWLRSEADDLRETWRLALLRSGEELAHQCDWPGSARLLKRLLASDGLSEDAVYGLMRAEALAGRRDAALRVYEGFRKRLLDELGLEPLDTTTALATAVRDGTLAWAKDSDDGGATAALETVQQDPPVTRVESTDVRPGPVRGLGEDATPFVGRALELAELHGLMRRGTHKLVTVHGPGGTGKTRIARQLVRERAGQHEHGAAWVPLAGATCETDAIGSISAALDMQVDLDAASLVAALAHRDLLLVLDQVEHLPQVAGLVMGLLDAAPGLQLMATSRVPLDLPGEAVVRLRGLTVPPSDEAEDAEAYDAVGLLLRAGRRTRPDLQPRGAERTALVALARLLDGSPLALELAAGWLRLLEPSELLNEVRQDLGVLRSRTADGDPAHASLGAVFESSWSLLNDSEREALRRLAVFRGGFTRDSAMAVTGVPLATLLALTNRSLLHRDGNTRFAMHPVVQHFTELKLAGRPATEAELATRHAAHFLTLAQDTDRRLDTPEQPGALARLTEERANVMAALERSLAAGTVDQAAELVAALGRFWRWGGRIHEGLAWTRRLKEADPGGEPSPAGVRVQLLEGLLLERIGDYVAANGTFEQALATARHLGDAELMTSALRDRSLVAWRRGDLDTARGLLEEVCASYRSLGLETDLAGALGNLGNVNRDAGDLQAAHAYFDEALTLVERIGHVWEIANTLNNKAITYSYGGDSEAAVREYQRAIELQRSIGNKSGLALTLGNLGIEHMDKGDLARADELYREALALAEEMGDADGIGHQNINLGILAQWRGDYDAAHAHYSVALKRRCASGAVGLVAQSVLAFLDLAVARGAFERSLVLSGIARQRLTASGPPLPAPHQAMYDECREKALANVDEDRAAELERRGEALPELEALEFTLGTRALPQ